MIDPDIVLSACIAAFRSIPELVSELGSSPLNIYSHTFSVGVEASFSRAVYEQPSPSVLVAYLDYLGGNFTGMSVWKHRLEAYIRPRNSGATPAHIFWLMMNKPVLGGTNNFRYTRLADNLQILDAMPNLTHQQAEDGSDLWRCSFVIGEIGDE